MIRIGQHTLRPEIIIESPHEGPSPEAPAVPLKGSVVEGPASEITVALRAVMALPALL